MPRDIYGLCMQYDKLDELKKFLIELFENPRMKLAEHLLLQKQTLQHFPWENLSTMIWSQLHQRT